MSKPMIAGMSLEQHVAAAQKAGESLECYGQAHGLALAPLYRARKRLRRKARAAVESVVDHKINDGVATAPVVSPAFVPIEIAAALISMKARLPNGIELDFSGVDALSWPTVAQTLASLPCSR